MSVVVYTESEKGKLKKSAFEVASYAHKVAQDLGTSVTAVTFNADDATSLGEYGVSKVLKISNDQLATFNAKAYASALAQAAEACLLYTSPSPRDRTRSRMPSSA